MLKSTEQSTFISMSGNISQKTFTSVCTSEDSALTSGNVPRKSHISARISENSALISGNV